MLDSVGAQCRNVGQSVCCRPGDAVVCAQVLANGSFWGRGVSDDKGGLLQAVHVRSCTPKAVSLTSATAAHMLAAQCLCMSARATFVLNEYMVGLFTGLIFAVILSQRQMLKSWHCDRQWKRTCKASAPCP